MKAIMINLRKIVMLFGFSLLVATPAYSATYYVRTDGGSATQCTGLADAPYPGTGSAQSCAFSHPFWAIAPKNHPTKMKGGDTLIIDGSNNAEYMMGYGAPNGSGTNTCNASWPYDCFTQSIPSGPDPAHPTRILGKGWDTGCNNPPQLWGTERTDRIINLIGSDNVELQCLEITDHSGCQEFGPSPCNRTTKPYGPWAKNGLRATDSENVLLRNINIHGLAHKGVFAGRLKDWTIEDSRIYANAIVGWDGDVGDFNSSNSGTITFTRVALQYSGCGETYPEEQPHSCYGQSQGGYGDGLGTHQTGGNWVFNNVDFSHNVSDGLDLLYHDGSGTVTIKRSRFEGNAGNQLKIATNAVVENSVIIGNCNYFNGKSFTSTKSPGFDNCRAGGNALVFSFHPGMKAEFYNSTLYGLGDTIVMSSHRTGCNGTETITSRNNIFLGDTQFGHPDIADLYYAAGEGGTGSGLCGQIAMNDNYSIIWGTKNIDTDCQGKSHSHCQDPKLAETNPHWYNGDKFNVNLLSNSPAKDKALTLVGKSIFDYNNYDRGGVWDIGALEFGSVPSGGSSEPPPEPTTPVNGSCSASNNNCVNGTVNDTTDSSTNYLWSCVGSNGGTTASCSLAKPINGVCGSTTSSCNSGSLNDTSDSTTNYLWSCAGVNGGVTASCSLPKTAAVSGVCGSTINSCVDGALSDTSDSSADYLWNCLGFNGGTTAYCTLSKPVPVDGACGTTNNSCAAGTSSDVVDSSTYYLWDCLGSNGGTMASCNLSKPVIINGLCGKNNNDCSAGVLNDTADSNTDYLWSCSGSNGGTTVSCSMTKSLVCGNGIKEGKEICDDGNVVNNDGCSSTCRKEYCGNGIKEGPEQCDDGNWVNRDGCSALCKLESSACGDGTVSGNEQCDDGNTSNGDGCSSFCSIEVVICGNGKVEGSEQCDDSNLVNGDGCSSLCKSEVLSCGNGIKEGKEICDDGNVVNNDGCSSTCRKEYCGDRTVQITEQCDDGNWVNRDGCSALCKLETNICGNGKVEGNEQCDDGNRTSKDGCSRNCSIEKR